MNKDKRNIYIDNIDLEEAIKKIEENIELHHKTELISVKDSCKRIVGKSIFAKRSSPSYSASAMDGIFLFSKLTLNATEVEPVFLNKNSFIYVNTGDPLNYKKGDTVMMIEDVIPVDENSVKIYKSIKPWENVRAIGEDIVEGEMILKENHLIQPQDLAALISAGITEIEVIKKPLIGIIPTGDEVVDIFSEGVDDIENKVVDSNSYMFLAMIEEWNGEGVILQKTEDRIESLKGRIEENIEKYDILVIIAGSSAGSKDFTKRVIEELGRVIVHGVGIKPGKPTIVGEIKGKPIFGIPGYPVSAFISLDLFLKPIIEKIYSVKNKDEYVKAELSKNIVSSLKCREYIRVSLSYIEDKLIATPLSRGAGITMSLVKADGILEIPKNLEGISKGKEVDIKLLKPIDEIKNYLISTGSHDIVMEHISDKIKLVSTNVGSFGGVLAIKNKTTHIAPIHILSEESGVYNIDILKKYFPSGDVSLIKGVKRKQGIMVEKGNPLNIKSIKDLTKEGVIFANRQRGSGTRILLDYFLTKEGIESEKINGYEREFSTHLEVAMAIKSKIATVGLGIKESATIGGLDFIPLKDEEYDFLVRNENLENSNIIEFINFLKSSYFKILISKIEGYSLENPGDIVRGE